MEKLKEKWRNLSVRKAIIAYIMVSLLICFLLSGLLTRAANRIQEQIWWKYVDKDSYFQAVEMETNGFFLTEIARPSAAEMTDLDHFISETCDFLQTYGILVLSITGVIVAVFLFYRDKLQIPLEEMRLAAQMVAKNDLDFHVAYQSQDELGSLCMEFERMRAELERTYREMWRMLEAEKALRAAIVHDIRTPLATLKGYQEMLLEFVPEGTLGKEKIAEMLEEGLSQIDRLNLFVEAMRKLSALEQREPRYEEISLQTLVDRIGKNVQILAKENGKLLKIRKEDGKEEFQADVEMILEVTENLVSNALRYAKEKVEVLVSWKENLLEICVLDDGPGFQESPEQATKAYYHSASQGEQKHLGLGLYISRIYCEKHGGAVSVGNRPQGGAFAQAAFRTKSIIESEL